VCGCLKFAAMVSVEVYEERFSRLKEVDPGKDKVIEDLISEVKELEHRFTEKKWDLEREQETTKVYQTKHYDVQIKLKNMEEVIVRLSKHYSLGSGY